MAKIRFCLVLFFSYATAYALPTVVVLSTGGTIAGKHDPTRGGYIPTLTGAELIASVPNLKDIANVQPEEFASINSADMTPAVWVRLAFRVRQALAKPDVAGVVVTHGTNTLEETAYFLDLVIASPKPVIIVGAQRPASDPYSDGPRNLLQAVQVAISPDARDKGCMVVMNGQINAARDVTKVHTNRVETFRSLEFGELGTVDPNGVRFYRAPLRRQTLPISATTTLPRVEIVLNYAGADGELVRSLLAAGKLGGLVIAGFGGGTVTGAMFQAIKEARAKDVPVVIGSRVPTGRMFPSSASPGSVVLLQRIGCVLADNLSPQKARVLLMLALTQTKEPVALQAYFDR
jgi:L-asparaginase